MKPEAKLICHECGRAIGDNDAFRYRDSTEHGARCWHEACVPEWLHKHTRDADERLRAAATRKALRLHREAMDLISEAGALLMIANA